MPPQPAKRGRPEGRKCKTECLSHQERHRINLDPGLYERWTRVKEKQGLTTAAEVAHFLLQKYEAEIEGSPPAYCVHCITPLKLICAQCELHLHELASETPQGSVPAVEETAAAFLVESDNNAGRVDSDNGVVKGSVKREENCQPIDSTGSGCDFGNVKVKCELSVENESVSELNGQIDESQTSALCRVKSSSYHNVPKSCELQNELSAPDDDGVCENNNHICEDGPGNSPAGNFVLDLSDIRAVQSFNVHSEDTGDADSSDHVTNLPDGTGDTSGLASENFQINPLVRAGTINSTSGCMHKGVKPVKKKRDKRIKPLLCEDCGCHFNRTDTFRFHKQSHMGYRPFACDVCEKTFQRLSILNNHRLIHKADRKYVCESCACSFKQMASLIRHRKIHTGQKPFSCSQCESSFTRKTHLTRHMLVHSDVRPYPCETCGMFFKDIPTLKKHKVVHTERKKYVCKECGSVHVRLANFKRHMKEHKNERSFTCQQCDRAFHRKQHMLRHMSTAHMGTLLDKRQASDSAAAVTS